GLRNNGKNYSRICVIRCRENKNPEVSGCNLIVFDWISIKLTIFASGWRKLCPDILEFRRSVMLIL
ncbi:hypothetical protein, partial [Bacteroides uniformis]|uniref:hypothetical protein n=1 Tax=Bacteroides uniformis TaxID=820 RepID=UPI00196134A8